MISAIVLAAGSSTRMGEPKPLVTVEDRPLLDHVLEALSASRVDETVVVLGAASDRVRRSVVLDSVRAIDHPGFAEGLSSSLRAGVAALSPESEAFFVVLADEPFVRSDTYDAMIDARTRTPGRVFLPVYEGVRGNPVLIDRTLSGEVETLVGDRGCRAIRLRHPNETVEVAVDDPGVLVDLDTPDDVRRARESLAGGRSRIEVLRDLARHPVDSESADRRPPIRARAPLDLWAAAGELERKREPFCLVIVIRAHRPSLVRPGARAIVRPDGSLIGGSLDSDIRVALVPECRRALEEGTPRTLRIGSTDVPASPVAPGRADRVMDGRGGGDLEVYVEPHAAAPQLVVVGDSPVAESLTSLGRLLGYRVLVAGVGLDAARFPDADELLDDIGSLATRLDRDSYAVVTTMAPYGVSALDALSRSSAPYIALVANRRRAGALFEELRGRGVTSEAIGRIHNPAGLSIGGESPEEIAVSIVAEIIQLRRVRGSDPAPPHPAGPS